MVFADYSGKDRLYKCWLCKREKPVEDMKYTLDDPDRSKSMCFMCNGE